MLKSDFDVTVTGPRAEADKILGLDVGIGAGDVVMLGNTAFLVIGTPGHTLGHLAYYDGERRPPLHRRCAVLARLRPHVRGQARADVGGPQGAARAARRTLVYCGHEYTTENARFAQSVDPRNAALSIRAAEAERMRADGRPTIPVTLGMEKRTNPFLRADQPALARAMGLEPGIDPSAVFAALRQAKDDFT